MSEASHLKLQRMPRTGFSAFLGDIADLSLSTEEFQKAQEAHMNAFNSGLAVLLDLSERMWGEDTLALLHANCEFYSSLAQGAVQIQTLAVDDQSVTVRIVKVEPDRVKCVCGKSLTLQGLARASGKPHAL